MFGDSRAVISQSRRKQQALKSRSERLSALRYEQLEERTDAHVEPDAEHSDDAGRIARRSRQRADQCQSTHGQPWRLVAIGVHGALPVLRSDPAALRYLNCHARRLSSADFAVDFDPNVFSVSQSDVHLGTIPANIVAVLPPSIQSNATFTQVGWSVTVSMSPTNPGQLNIHLAANSPYANITSGTATSSPQDLSDFVFATPTSTPTGPVVGSIDSLVMIDFHIKSTAALGRTQINLAASNAAERTADADVRRDRA